MSIAFKVTIKTIHDRCEEVGDCWMWKQARTKPGGYPRLQLVGSPSQYAHVAAWILTNGPIKQGLFVRRTCESLLCCNPAHMRLMTRAQLNKLAAARGGWKDPSRQMKIAAAARERFGKLTLEQAQMVRSSPLSGSELARHFGVSKHLISHIRLNKSYRVAAPNATIFHQRA